MTLIAQRPGPWTATFNAVALGITTDDGFTLRYRRSSEKINNTNLYGDSLIDGIFRGYGSVQLLATFKEWNVALQHAMFPHSGASPPVFDGIQGVVGTLDSAQAEPIVLSAVAGTPAASANVAGVANANTFTAAKAIIAPENDVEFLFAAKQTDVPILFDLLLYDDTGTKRFFEWSNV